MDSVKIGKYIFELRKQKGYTQQDLADRLGITNKAISKWETGEGLPDISVIPALAEILGTTADSLLRGEAYPASNVITEANGSNEVAQYLLNKRLLRFKTEKLFSLLVGIAGIVLTAAVWVEEQNFYSFAIGIFFEIVSIGIFAVRYIITKGEAENYNAKFASGTVDCGTLWKGFSAAAVWVWLFVPMLTFSYFISYYLCFDRLKVLVMSVFLYAAACITAYVNLKKTK